VTATLRLTTSPSDLDRAAALLRAGGLVAIPTETVYGLAVRADDADAVARLFAAKDRPPDNPLIVHVADVAGVAAVAREITPLARRLLERFAPGPLTVVLDARDGLPRSVTGGLDTVAVRVPDHAVAREVLRRCGAPLAAPSANRSSRPSPTRVEHVLADLDGRIDAVVDGGPTRIGLESTVVDARGRTPRVLRDGGVSREDLAAALGAEDQAENQGEGGQPDGDDPGDSVRSPGTRHRHYAPGLPVHLATAGDGSALAARTVARLAGETGSGRVGLIAIGLRDPHAVPEGVVVLGEARDAHALAAELFSLLRRAEELGLAAVVVESVAETGIGRAVMDRLQRAAEASGGSVAR
jgi:L-threonylcarbamoyladenylate synthase